MDPPHLPNNGSPTLIDLGLRGCGSSRGQTDTQAKYCRKNHTAAAVSTRSPTPSPNILKPTVMPQHDSYCSILNNHTASTAVDRHSSEEKKYLSNSCTNLKERKRVGKVHCIRALRNGQGNLRERVSYPVPPQRRSTSKKPKRCTEHSYQLNRVVSAAKIPINIHILLLNYNEKGNLSGVMVPARTSSMLLRQHRELKLKASTQLDQDITDAIRDQG